MYLKCYREKEGGSLQKGDLLAGKYRILKSLGKGGEGSVWLSVHIRTEQLWAVKEIPRKEGGHELHELNMMKKLRASSLPRIVDVLEDDGAVYLVMEYIRGQNLDQWMKKNGCLSPELVLDVGMQISHALHYLHNRPVPVFHLDIKPANLILDKAGRVFLVDFGASGRITKEGMCIPGRGTDGFAAPEQYGIDKKIGAQTDIYGLGATLYYLVSGVRYSTALEKSRVPGCPEALGAVIRKCVQKEPENRYASARQLEKSLHRIMRQKEASQGRIRLLAAILLIILAAGAAKKELTKEFFQQAKEKWNYEKLLEEALCTQGEESNDYYRQAVFLEPERKEAYLQLLEDMASDAVFEEEEERRLRQLYHTISPGQQETYEERLAQNADCYGEVAVQTGLLYWFSYEKEGGKRIAAGWFQKAVDAGSRLEEADKNEVENDWIVRAEIFSHMGSYYGKLGKQTDEEENFGKTYWEDLSFLLKSGAMKQEKSLMELQFYKEAVDQILFLAEELREAGVTREEVEAILQLMQKNIDEKPETEGDRKLKRTDENMDQRRSELVQGIDAGIQRIKEILENQERIAEIG